MTCKHCRKSIPDDAICCPYCAEPTPQHLSDEDIAWEQQELERKAKTRAALNTKLFRTSVILGICFPLLLVFPLLMFNLKTSTYILILFLILLFTGTMFPTIAFFYARGHLYNESVVKWKQFVTDKTSICPMCGSHTVKAYRKGYNWNEAFWGNAFNIKGSRYIAGMGSNDAMCFCENCGHKWNTHYDIRTIK